MLREQAQKRKGNRSACACGQFARFRKHSALEVVTLLGRVRVERAYYHCPACGQGHAPLDAAWSLGLANTTPLVQALVAALGAFGSYTQTPALLRRVRPQVSLDVKTVEYLAQAVGAQVAADPPPGYGAAERPLAVAVDGVILPMRGGGKEARCGVVYEPHWNTGRTPADCGSLRKEFFATLEERDTLVAAVCARVEVRRPTPSTPVAALGDGAEWIWEGYARHLPHRVEILDFYHVSERLALIATALYADQPGGTVAAKQWRQQMEQELQDWGPRKLVEALEQWRPAGAAAQKVREDQLRYFRNHYHRMHYPEYLRAGFPIGSGAVEGACKHVVSDRFRGAGMRWKSRTAEPLLQLRAALLTHPDLDLHRYAVAANCPS
jgi:hypothetical protein